MSTSAASGNMVFDKERFALYFSHLLIPAKEGGGEDQEEGSALGRYKLNPPQIYLLNQIADGLNEEGTHIFWVLKAAQQGCTTFSLGALSYWCQTHPGMVFGHIAEDTDHKEINRALLAGMLEGMDDQWSFPVPKNNRVFMQFDNGSRIVWLNANANVSAKKKTGLAQGIGMLGVHGTEIGSWRDERGVKLMMSRLAEHNPNRLYIFEGTSKGAGLFKDYWMDAAQEGATGLCAARAIFLGWWLNPFYAFDLNVKAHQRMHEKYWSGRYSKWEEARVESVYRRYGYRITDEQISWMRWKGDESYRGSEELLLQEYPWVPEDAWVYGAQGFINSVSVSLAQKKAKVRLKEPEFKPVKMNYEIGCDFKVSKFTEIDSGEEEYDLIVFEPPNHSVDKSLERIVISLDPAHGANDESDLAVIEVWRAHTDKLIQLAEYTKVNAPAHHLAWVILELSAFYDASTKVIYELQGGGYAVHDHLKMLRDQITTGYNKSLIQYFQRLDFYRYARPDGRTRAAQSEGYVTSGRNRPFLLDNLRSNFELGRLEVRSLDLLTEMKDTIKEEDGYIKPAYEDNRLFAAAFGIEGWNQVIIEDIRDLDRFSYESWLQAIGQQIGEDGDPFDLSAGRAHLMARVAEWKEGVNAQIAEEKRINRDKALGNFDEFTDNWDQVEEIDSGYLDSDYE